MTTLLLLITIIWTLAILTLLAAVHAINQTPKLIRALLTWLGYKQ